MPELDHSLDDGTMDAALARLPHRLKHLPILYCRHEPFAPSVLDAAIRRITHGGPARYNLSVHVYEDKACTKLRYRFAPQESQRPRLYANTWRCGIQTYQIIWLPMKRKT